jgi:hypothetical protein
MWQAGLWAKSARSQTHREHAARSAVVLPYGVWSAMPSCLHVEHGVSKIIRYLLGPPFPYYSISRWASQRSDHRSYVGGDGEQLHLAQPSNLNVLL